jgi:hypothetical protein
MIFNAPPSPAHRSQGLESCHLLQVLLAPHNMLPTLPPAALARWPLLRRLDLSGNRLAALPSLPPLPHLETLELSDNQIAVIAPLAAAALPLLRRLDLSFNALPDLGCVARLTALPALESLQLHDNPAAALAGYNAAVAAALPWLREHDRRRLGERQWEGQEPPAGAARQQARAREAAAGRAANAAAREAGVALQLMLHLRSFPDAAMGASSAQRRAAAQHWLPALMAAGSASGCRHLSSEQQKPGDWQHAQWSHSSTISLAHKQSLEWAALAALKPRQLLRSASAAGGGGQGRARVEEPGLAGAEVGANSLGWPAPAWVAEWEAETGLRLEDVGCAELAEAVGELSATPRQPGANCRRVDGGSSCRGGRGSLGSSSGSGASSGASGGGGGGSRPVVHAPAWLEAQEAHERRVLSITLRHLDELLAAPQGQQEVLEVHTGYSRRLVHLEAAKARESAAVTLQTAWRGLEQRGRLAEALRARAAAAAAALQAAWRGRAVRREGRLPRLRAEAAEERARRGAAAVVLQAAARGWLVRRRLHIALAAARSEGRTGCSTGHAAGRGSIDAEESLGSLEGVGDDFLQLAPGLEAELMGSQAAAGWLPGARAADDPQCWSVSGSGGRTAEGGADDHGGGGSSCDGSECSSGSGSGADDSGGEQGGGSPAELRAARLDARLRGLMAEWGFNDMATALAYHK